MDPETIPAQYFNANNNVFAIIEIIPCL